MKRCVIYASWPATHLEYSTMVRVLGFEPVGVSSNEEAARALRSSPMAVIVIDEWSRLNQDPLWFVRQVPSRNRPALIVVEEVRHKGHESGANYVVHRNDAAGLRDALAEIELRLHEQKLDRAETEYKVAAE